MTINDIGEFINNSDREISQEEFLEAIEIFKEDAEDKAEYVSEFLRFGFAIGRFENGPFLDDLHLCNQMYIATVQNHAELKKLHLPYLYLKEIEYFTLVNSYSECLRTINRIMDLDDVPDFCMGAALSQAVDLFMASGLTHEAEKYVEALRVFSNVCDLPARNLIMIDCNLMQAYAYMGKRKEYEYFRKSTTRYPEKSLDEGVISIVKLYVLGAEAMIDSDREPTREYVREVCELMETGSFRTGLTADFAEMIVPIFKWIKNAVAQEKIVEYVLSMINASEIVADKLGMFSLLVDELKLDRYKYYSVYDEYYATLRAYYDNDCEIRRHEVVGEMMSYELEKQYRARAMTDELTGIGNRHAYESEIDSIIAERINGKVPNNVVVFSMDVNGLKHVNDTFGHQAGDDYIRGAADCLKMTMGNYGNVYRTGGDEFAAIIRARNFPDEEVVALLRKYLSEWSDSYGNHLTMSVGVGKSADNPECNIEEIIGIADEAMYKDKRAYYQQSGRDRRQR